MPYIGTSIILHKDSYLKTTGQNLCFCGNIFGDVDFKTAFFVCCIIAIHRYDKAI